MIQVQDLHDLFAFIAQQIHQKRDELCELDGFAGDGDHGISMDLGWTALCNVTTVGVQDCGEYLKQCAKAFIQAVGASIGPLYGTALLRAAKYAQGKNSLTVCDVITMFISGVKGMQERGKAQQGDKTLLDTLIPAAEMLREAKDSSKSVERLLEEALKQAYIGMESTKEMVANIGRSSRLGERSRGGVDPGAASAYVVLQAMQSFILARLPEQVRKMPV